MAASSAHCSVHSLSYDAIAETVDVHELLADSGGHRIAWLHPRRVTALSQTIDHAGTVLDPVALPRPNNKHLPCSWWGLPFETPAMSVASLDNVTVFGGYVASLDATGHEGGHTLVVDDKYLVPDSFFLRSGRATLPREVVTPVDAEGGFDYAARPTLDEHAGVHFLIGGAHAHFGHFLLEGLSRLWALDLVRALRPTFVVYQPEIRDMQRKVFAALGIDEAQILCLQRPARLERLIVPSVAFHLHVWTSPQQDRVWEALGDRFDATDETELAYLSRTRFTKRRALRNEAQVEQLFRRLGFRIVHSETLPLEEQIALARSCRVLAGSAGSAMYLGAFQRKHRRKIIITPAAYTLIDDALISTEREGTLDYFICPNVDPSYKGSPRYADYDVDLAVLEKKLPDLVSA